MKYADWLHGMWFVVLNAIFIHFYHFHPYPSPRPVKYCHLKKRRKTALCGRIALFYLHMIPYGVIFGIIEQKIENGGSESIVQNWTCSMLRITYIAFFGKQHFPHHSKQPFTTTIVNPIYYHFPNYPYYTNCYNISYSLQLYRYYNTVIAM